MTTLTEEITEMGIGTIALLVTLLLEVAGLLWSFYFGRYIVGEGLSNLLNLFFSTAVGVRQLGWHVTALQIGLTWAGLNALVHLLGVAGYAKQLFKQRVLLGNPGIDEIEVVEQVFHDLNSAPAPVGLQPVVHLSWPRTFDYITKYSSEIYFLGRRLTIGEGLFKSPHLKPLIAHQLGYYNSGDLWIRLILAWLPHPLLVLGLIAGLPLGLGPFLTRFFWPWYWRRRMYEADLFAARLGQAHALIQALDQIVRPYEKRKNVFFREYPYVAERIDNLRRRAGIYHMPRSQSSSSRRSSRGAQYP